MSDNVNALEVIVFGNSAVGKTSLLSSMYMQMEAQGVSSCNGMTFTPVDDEEFKILKNKWVSLRESIRSSEFTSPPPRPYQGTTQDVEHDFVFQTRHNALPVRFVDTKGGATGNLDSKLIARINNSFLTICVVDAAILMECDDTTNDTLNCPHEIKRILQRILEDNDETAPISCMFVLTKCEKYMRTQEERKRMVARFEKIFSSALMYAADQRFPLFYLPVQTMGCVEFSMIDPITKELKFKTVNQNFQPKDVIFPLAHLLKVFLSYLNYRQENMSWLEWITSWFYNVQEDYNLYYNTLIERVNRPIDFRGNLYGTSQHMEPMDFWND